VCSVIAAVVLATHPLPPSAIADLTCSEVNEVMSILRSMQSLLRLQEDPDQPVYPFHKLLSDLLTSPTRGVDERFYISPGKFHSEITLNCLKLMNETLGDHLQFMGSIALKYACTSWHTHLSESREDVTTLIPTLHHFLEDKIGAWLEVLAGLREDPVFALKKAMSWLHEVCLGLFWGHLLVFTSFQKQVAEDEKLPKTIEEHLLIAQTNLTVRMGLRKVLRSRLLV